MKNDKITCICAADGNRLISPSKGFDKKNTIFFNRKTGKMYQIARQTPKGACTFPFEVPAYTLDNALNHTGVEQIRITKRNRDDWLCMGLMMTNKRIVINTDMKSEHNMILFGFLYPEWKIVEKSRRRTVV